MNTKDKVDAQAEAYTQALRELETQRTQKSFQGVYNTWLGMQRVGTIEKLKVDDKVEAAIAAAVKQIQGLEKALTAIATGCIKRLNTLTAESNLDITEPGSIVLSSPPLPSVAPNVQGVSVAASGRKEEGVECGSCRAWGQWRFQLVCGHMMCRRCGSDAVQQRLCEGFPESFKLLMECKNCHQDTEIEKVRLLGCGCVCDTKMLKQKLPFQWSQQRSAYEWPSCTRPEHKLDLEDTLCLWGLAVVQHFERDLTAEVALQAYEAIPNLSYLIVTRAFTLEQFAHLAKVLRLSKTIKHAIFGPKTVSGVEKVRLLAEALGGNKSIQTLIVKQSQIGSGEGARLLADALIGLPQLQTLAFSGTELGAAGAKILADGLLQMTHCNITTFCLSNNEIGVQGAKSISGCLDCMKGLTKLYLDNNKLGMKGAKHVAVAVERATSLQLLHLSGNGVGAEGAKCLSAAIEKANCLQTLVLHSNEVATEGAKSLAELIDRCQTVCSLGIQQNRIGIDAAKRLAEVVEKSTTLRTLNIAENFITTEGVKVLVRAAELSPALKYLDVSLHKVSPEDSAEFRQRLETKGVLLKI